LTAAARSCELDRGVIAATFWSAERISVVTPVAADPNADALVVGIVDACDIAVASPWLPRSNAPLRLDAIAPPLLTAGVPADFSESAVLRVALSSVETKCTYCFFAFAGEAVAMPEACSAWPADCTFPFHPPSAVQIDLTYVAADT
jgi:hypothetical protein